MSPEEDQGQGRGERGGLPDGLRTAVERTLAATADTAAETAERAQGLLDEVARRGQEAREEVAKRGQRTREGLSRVRLGSADEVKDLNERLADIEQRLAQIETALRTAISTPAPPPGQSNPKAES
jgi:polyhydroxyalkanoate synthesis regulator phasin